MASKANGWLNAEKLGRIIEEIQSWVQVDKNCNELDFALSEKRL